MDWWIYFQVDISLWRCVKGPIIAYIEKYVLFVVSEYTTKVSFANSNTSCKVQSVLFLRRMTTWENI